MAITIINDGVLYREPEAREEWLSKWLLCEYPSITNETECYIRLSADTYDELVEYIKINKMWKESGMTIRGGRDIMPTSAGKRPFMYVE